ncbi:MAG: N-acetyltransferase family protein [Allosphingosinicella sp.]
MSAEPDVSPPQPAPSVADCTELGTWTGFHFEVRPAAPGDLAAVADFFGKVSPEDRRFRFLSAVQKLDHAMLERLTSVDHDRTEDFLAFDDDVLIASAMLAADPAMERAEVAIAIRADYKDRGVGWALLSHLARYAREKGIGLIESIECRDNADAIALEQEMGFTATSYPGDATLVLLQKKLD